MKVKELSEKLKGFDQELEVVLPSSQEDICDTLSHIVEIGIMMNVDRFYVKHMEICESHTRPGGLLERFVKNGGKISNAIILR